MSLISTQSIPLKGYIMVRERNLGNDSLKSTFQKIENEFFSCLSCCLKYRIVSLTVESMIWLSFNFYLNVQWRAYLMTYLTN